MNEGTNAARKFRARHCTGDACGLRFPVDDASPLGDACPLCGAPTRFVDAAYETYGASANATSTVQLEVLLDNIRSLRNVGSIFRTADGAGVRHLHLCGVTPTPEHPKLVKTSLGAEAAVPWTRYADATVAATTLLERGARLWAIEGGERATSLFDPGIEIQPERPVVLVFGHEVSGVDPRILERCERVVSLPMMGVKSSLNVSVAMGIAAYVLRFSGQ